MDLLQKIDMFVGYDVDELVKEKEEDIEQEVGETSEEEHKED